MIRRRCWHSLASLLLLAACADDRPPPNPASFSRPAHVAFACLDLGGPTAEVAPRNCCATAPMAIAEAVEDPGCAFGGTSNPYSLHALVTQTATGEVAAVDLAAERVEDSRNDIPGATFVPTGELPAAVAVGQSPPRHTYVANGGSGDVTVLRTATLRALAPGQVASVQRPLRLGGRPIDMVLAPGDAEAEPPVPDRLLVTLPSLGQLLVIPVREDGTLHAGDVDVIALSASIGTPGPAGPDPYVFHHADGSVEGPVCERYALRELPADPLPAPDVAGYEGITPEPGFMAIDANCPPGEACTPRVLVADMSLPIIHVISLEPQVVELPPLVTGAPVSHVAVTPWVPALPPGAPGADDPAALSQYVYAIDAADGSVLALRDGQLLRVSDVPDATPDRLPLRATYSTGGAVATTLEVVHPGYSLRGEDRAQYIAREGALDSPGGQQSCFGDDADGQDARRLRGVFLAVGLADGTIQFVDVHDLELAECSSCPIALRRHAPRIAAGYRGDDVDPDEDLPELIGRAVLSTPSFLFEEQLLRTRTDGTTFDSRVAGLSCISCDPDNGLYRAFPDAEDLDDGVDAPPMEPAMGDDADPNTEGEGDAMNVTGADNSLRPCAPDEALICAEADPWHSADEGWTATFEGILPGSGGGAGRFRQEGDALFFDVELDPCAVGVLGADALDGRPGDLLAIRSTLPPAGSWDDLPEQTRADCEMLRALRESDDPPRLAFPVQRAERTEAGGGRLRIGRSFATRVEGISPGDQEDWAFIEACFLGEPLAYDLRAQRGYLVAGGREGFRHSVVAGPGGGCALDPDAPAYLRGRAWSGEIFQNHAVRFQLATLPPSGTALRFSFGVDDLAPTLTFDAANGIVQRLDGVLPTTLRYSPQDEYLYMVDIHQRGLLPMPLDPLPLAIATSADYE